MACCVRIAAASVCWVRISATPRPIHGHCGGVLGAKLVVASQRIEDGAELLQSVWVVAGGKTVLEGRTRQVFARVERLRAVGPGLPQVTEVAQELRARGAPVRPDILTVDDAA